MGWSSSCHRRHWHGCVLGGSIPRMCWRACQTSRVRRRRLCFVCSFPGGGRISTRWIGSEACGRTWATISPRGFRRVSGAAMSAIAEHPEIRSQHLENGETLIELNLAERPVSRLYIIPLTISIGVARVRIDGIGGVETEEEYRGRGYARRVMEAALARMGGAENTMSQDPAALSFLFGISNYYEKFGYARAGPWYSLHLTELAGGDPLPVGWTVRPCTPHDLPASHALYERGTAQAVGAVIRHPSGRVWSTLAGVVAESSRDECRVVVDPSGVVAAYAWRGRDFWPVDTEEETPDALAIGEAIAFGPAAADV